ncbi:MAG TPA: S-methyl-5-thioribose-1-phosphate isomerase, partial [Dehalococcoidales bacterium]
MKVRGAPAIGVAGAYGIALGALNIRSKSRDDFIARFRQVSQAITATRPTARNLFWAAERMERVAARGRDIDRIKKALVQEAIQ